MKRVIRKSIFETNSSSMHAICIRNNVRHRYTPVEIAKDVHVYSDGKIFLGSDSLNFERYPFQMLFSLFDKCRYAIAVFGEERYSEIRDIFCEAYNAAEKELPSELKSETICSDFDIPEAWNDQDELYYGYVDHQSKGLLGRFLSERQLSLREFLINPKYMIVVDGDEYGDFKKYMEAGLIKGVDKVVYPRTSDDPDIQEWFEEQRSAQIRNSDLSGGRDE